MIHGTSYFARSSKNKWEEFAGFEKDGDEWSMDEGEVILRLHSNSVTIRKDVFSTAPLFISSSEGFLVCSDSWLTVLHWLKSLGIALHVNMGYFWDFLRFQTPLTRETLCREIVTLRVGECVTIGFSGECRFEKSRDTIRRKMPLLGDFQIDDHLKQRIEHVDLDNSTFHLSAGLDSSILSILASKIFPGRQINVATLKSRGARGEAEVEIAEKAARDFNLNLKIIDVTQSDIFREGRRLIENCLGYPLAHPSHLARLLLDTPLAEKRKCIVTGRGADEFMAGYPWHDPGYAELSVFINRIAPTPENLLGELFLGASEAGAFGNAHDNLLHFFGGGPLPLRQRLNYELETLFEAWNIIERAFSHYLGIRYDNPFTDPVLLDWLHSLPEDKLFANGSGKAPLREAFGATYPKYILEAPKRGLTFDVREYLLDYSFRDLMEALYDGSEFSRMHLNRSTTEKMLRDTIDGTRNYGWQLWDVYVAGISYSLINQGHKG